MTLFVHRAERSDALAAGLADLLSTPSADVFAQEVVSVPARGVERWLAQQLSHRLGRRDGRGDGICAGVRFPSPTALINEVTNGPDRRTDPWAPDALVWPLLEVIDDCAGEPWCVTLGWHLGVGAPDGERAHRQGRRYSVARRLAGLFDAYATERPPMLADWAADRDTDGRGHRLPEDLRWQAELWRRVRDRIALPDPLDRRAQAVAALREHPDGVALPPRLSLFGPTRLASGQLEVLTALGLHRDVHLWLPHPSPALWQALAGRTAEVPRRSDTSVTAARHPLLASLGRDVRELQLTLGATGYTDVHHRPLTDEPATTLLAALQRDIADNRIAGIEGGPRLVLRPADRSVQVHACHGPARQVEVLREVIVGLLADDPTLEPRDVLVMCPDIESYAPLVAAAFGLADVVPEATAHPAHRLRVRLADRALTQTNPLLATVARLLDLADGRVSASEVLDLASWAPVRRRFGFDDDDLDQLARWVAQAGVRWGIDAPHRSAYGLQRFPQNTWRAGLDRILLGVAMADEDGNRLGLALPLDDVGSGDAELAGRLAELLDRLQWVLDAFTGTRPLRAWLDTLTTAVDLLTAVGSDDAWQQAEVRRELGDVAEAAGGRVEESELRRSDVRSLLSGRLGGRPTRANFRTGTLTVCTMIPMRSVPHRVVCLLGLDDGVYPRNPRPDGDDILARAPAVGERDARGQDRQLMLDAMMATTEHLVITYTGADERTGAVRPPAVPLGELLDALDETAVWAGGCVQDRVLTRHPLQPYDPRNVTPGALGADGPFSHDRTALAGARAAAGLRREPARFLADPLPAAPTRDVELAELIALLVHPARGFLRQRLGVASRFEEDEPADSLSVELDSLQLWALGDRLLAARLAGVDDAACQQAEWRRGVLPPGPLGRAALDGVLQEVGPLVDRTAALLAPPRRAVDVAVPLGGGRELRGTVAGVHGTAAVSVGYSKLGPKPQLAAWVSLLALTAAAPDRGWTAVAVGRGEPSRPRSATFGPLDQQTARRHLLELVDLFDRGRREPLPLPLKSSLAYASSAAKLEGPDLARSQAVRSWASAKFPGEDADLAHALVWGPAAPFDSVFTAAAPPDEQWAGEPTRFGELSLRLWAPLLQHRRLVSL